MKKVLLVLVIGCIIFSCNSVFGQGKAKRDTVTNLGVHMNYGLKGIKWGIVDRITVPDSVSIVKVDATTWKEKKTKVVYYRITVDAPVDSALSKQFNVPIIDSLGKQNFISLYSNADPKYVVEPVQDLNKALKYLEQYLIREKPLTLKK